MLYYYKENMWPSYMWHAVYINCLHVVMHVEYFEGIVMALNYGSDNDTI